MPQSISQGFLLLVVTNFVIGKIHLLEVHWLRLGSEKVQNINNLNKVEVFLSHIAVQKPAAAQGYDSSMMAFQGSFQ